MLHRGNRGLVLTFDAHASSWRYLAQTATHLFSACPSRFSSRMERAATRDLRCPCEKSSIRFECSGRPPLSASKKHAGTAEGLVFDIALRWTSGFVRWTDSTRYDPSMGDGCWSKYREQNAGKSGTIPPSRYFDQQPSPIDGSYLVE